MTTSESRKHSSMNNQIDERLGSVEVRQAKMETTLEAVVNEVTKVGNAVTALTSHIDTMSRPNWANWFQAAVFVVAVIGAFAGMFIRPIQLQVQYEHERISEQATSFDKKLELIESYVKQQFASANESLKSFVSEDRVDDRDADAKLSSLTDRMSRLEVGAELSIRQNALKNGVEP